MSNKKKITLKYRSCMDVIKISYHETQKQKNETE